MGELDAARERLRREARLRCAEALLRLGDQGNGPVTVLLYELQRIQRMAPHELLAQRAPEPEPQLL
jgi:hypothetical protein